MLQADSLTKTIAGINRSMAETASGALQITNATEELRKQSEQAARALVEQTRAMKDLTSASQNISGQIKLITRANLGHSAGMDSVQKMLRDIRSVAAHNVEDAKTAQKISEDLLDRSAELSGSGGNGKAKASWRGRKKRELQAHIPNGRG